RGEATGMPVRKDFQELPIGKGRRLRPGHDLAILTYGAIGKYATKVCDRLETAGISAAHYDLRFCKPLDGELLTEVFEQFDRVITLEDGVVQGGAGSAVLEWMADHSYSAQVLRLGLPDEFVEHGTQRQLHDLIGIGPDGIYQHALDFMQQDDPVAVIL
ncbi:MAG TPA: transketolase C-terminal domain-containing protein, partial [Rhodothermales bacterium]|nr:transketolase C-terminal domain-containing protein [Rhodothermales bacterium]